MKNTKECPKCKSVEVINIKGDRFAGGAGNNIPVGSFLFNAVKVDRYLCTDCGYSEEWIDKKEDIEKLKKKFKN